MGSSSRIGARLKKTHRGTHVLGLVILYVFGSVIVRQFNSWQTPKLQNDFQINNNNDYAVVGGRKLLSLGTDNNNNTSPEINSTKPRCTNPSIEEFPRDVFSHQERKYGAVVLHVILAIYMFLALAFVCDDYFISSLDKICEHFDLSEDVAGATFMAAGSSAPELFTAIIGVFVAKGDVGVGTIVGSAVFNILVIIALCALFAGQVIQLTWWPLFRDSVYYIIAITALILTLYDGTVRWYESMIMIFLYFGYILLMKFNPMIVKRINNREKMRKAISERVSNSDDCKVEEGLEDKVSVKYVDGGRRTSVTDLSEAEDGGYEMKERARITWKELGLMIMLSDKFPPTTRFRAACLMVIHREDRKRMLMQRNADEAQQVVESSDVVCSNNKGKGDISLDNNPVKQHDSTSSSSEGGGDETPFLYPHGSPFKVIFWLLTLPLVTILYFTIPDCRKARWESWWLVTFLLSIFWIMVFSYIMVWMVCVIGFTLGVPDVIMGIIFLAAGTSIPDAISSLLVAREGMGDMAVSNSIGSNIFDILIGLAVPWFLKTAIVTPGKGVQINSNGMVYSVGLLFISVVITVLSIYCNKWRLDFKLGVFFTLLYLVFVTLSACIEFNLFVFVNLPTCAYDG